MLTDRQVALFGPPSNDFDFSDPPTFRGWGPFGVSPYDGDVWGWADLEQQHMHLRWPSLWLWAHEAAHLLGGPGHGAGWKRIYVKAVRRLYGPAYASSLNLVV